MSNLASSGMVISGHRPEVQSAGLSDEGEVNMDSLGDSSHDPHQLGVSVGRDETEGERPITLEVGSEVDSGSQLGESFKLLPAVFDAGGRFGSNRTSYESSRGRKEGEEEETKEDGDHEKNGKESDNLVSHLSGERIEMIDGGEGIENDESSATAASKDLLEGKGNETGKANETVETKAESEANGKSDANGKNEADHNRTSDTSTESIHQNAEERKDENTKQTNGNSTSSDQIPDRSTITGTSVEIGGTNSANTSPAASTHTNSDSDSEDEDEPPTFKYTRLKGLPAGFFTAHPLSTATFHESVFVFGTHTGLIHLARPDMTPIRTFKGHNASVLALHTDGTHFVSGSMDGTVVIGAVFDDKDIVRHDFKRPVHAVVLDRQYAKSRAFLYGGMAEEVVLCTRNWLDQRVDTVLERSHGPIVALAAVDDLVVWMNDSGITCYHMVTRQVVSVIAKPAEFRSDLHWPRIAFPETDRLLVAWGNYIWSLRVSARTTGGAAGAGASIKSRYFAGSLSFRASNEKKVEIEHVFKVDFVTSGIASFHDDQWIALAYNPQAAPDVRLLRALDGSTTYEEEIGLSSDTSGEQASARNSLVASNHLNGDYNLGLNDYHLGHYIGTPPRYFVLSARAGVVAEQVQLSDRLQWFLDRKLYHQAWTMSQHVVSAERRLGFGVAHLESLVRVGDWESATRWISTLLADTELIAVGDAKSTLATGASSALADEKELLAKESAAQWAYWCRVFLSAGRVAELTAVIPTDPQWNLPKAVYLELIKHWLVEDQKRAFELLSSWDVELYDAKDVAGAMEELLERTSDNEELRRHLVTLYERTYEPAKAVPHLQTLRDSNIIPFLAANHILPAFVPQLPTFARLRFSNESDIERLPISTIQERLSDVTQILVDSRHEIAPATVVRLMCDSHLDILAFFYLEELAAIDELLVKGFENDMVQLYAQYARPKLLPFLSANNNYSIDDAIAVCEANAFVDELVYLLAQVGENKKALTLILHELDDPQRAVNFAKSQNEHDIWNIVLEHSFSRPSYIKTLIESADEKSNAFYNPITILQHMDADLDIAGLKDSVTLVARDNDMALVVNQLLYNIVAKRSEKVSHKFHLDELRGVQVSASDAALEAKFDSFRTVALRRDSAGLVVVERLGSEPANMLYTTLEHKLDHVKKVRAKS